MANMSYCRFQNTVRDLRDCFDNIYAPLSDDERRARLDLVVMAKDIVEAFGFQVVNDAGERADEGDIEEAIGEQSETVEDDGEDE